MKTLSRFHVTVGLLAAIPWVAGAQSAGPSGLRAKLDASIASNQRAIVTELVELVSIPNLVGDAENIEKNSAAVRSLRGQRRNSDATLVAVERGEVRIVRVGSFSAARLLVGEVR